MPIIEHSNGTELNIPSEGKHVIMFHLPGHCAGCKVALNTLENKELADVAVELIDAGNDSNRALSEAYGVTSAPTLIVFSDGSEIGRMCGLKEFIAKNKELIGD